jgi:hypothetical protein
LVTRAQWRKVASGKARIRTVRKGITINASIPDEPAGRNPGPDPGDGHLRGVEVAGSLPISMTSFVGRDRELDEIRLPGPLTRPNAERAAPS